MFIPLMQHLASGHDVWKKISLSQQQRIATLPNCIFIFCNIFYSKISNYDKYELTILANVSKKLKALKIKYGFSAVA